MSATHPQPPVSTAMEPFEYSAVRLRPGLFAQRFGLNRQYLASLANDSLLYPFRYEALLPTPGQPFGHWEAITSRVRGHFFGHYLSACARTYATSDDGEIKAKADYLVAELAKCQQANGDGYAGPIPERYLQRVEQRGPDAYVWCPYYMIHKTMMGCYEMYRYAGNQQALDILDGMARYVKRRIDRLSDAQMAHMLTEEHGGMAHVLYQLYRTTGDPEHLTHARRWDHHAFLAPLAQNEDRLTFVHANTNLPKVYGAAEAYEATGEVWYRDVALNFWSMIYPARTYATGGSNSQELWAEPGKLRNTLAPHAPQSNEAPGTSPKNHNQETCTTFNWMWLARYLLRWTGQVSYADQYERNLYNGIISAQNPDTGMFIYFTPMLAGSRKVYGTPTETFWCCYGTGVQACSDLAGGIYYHDPADETLYVNLFAPSEVRWQRAAGAVRIEQETTYPLKPQTRLTVHLQAPQSFELALRIPWWVGDDVAVAVNGTALAGPLAPSSYCRIRREWQDDDVIELTMPMHFYLEPLPDAPDIAALMYGPLVMAVLAEGEVALRVDRGRPESWLEPNQIPGRNLRFLALSPEEDRQVLPLYQVKDERYTMYLRFL